MTRSMLSLVLALASTAALAQSAPPVAQSKPPATAPAKSLAKSAAKSAPKSAMQQAPAVRLQACLDIDDGTKDRLNCYDAVIAPAPKPKEIKVKGVADCKFSKEEDARLACYNGFVENMPKLPRS